MLLVADIGGTKVKIATIDISHVTWDFKNQEEYTSLDYKTLEDIISFYLKKHNHLITAIALGVAGPVNHEESQITNLPWTIKTNTIREKFNIQNVFLLNDLEAHAHGISTLSQKDLVTLQKGNPSPGNSAIIAVGTGLGECILFWNGKEHSACSSEGGHADFGPQNTEDIELLEFLFEKNQHVSWERVLSGCFGFLNIYSFLRDQKKLPPSNKIECALKKGEMNLGPLILEEAGKGDLISTKCLERFVGFYGAEAGNLALKSFAVHGVYLAGGIAPKILSYLKTELFLNAFSNKGRQSNLMKQIPIYIITDPDLPLKGLAHFARKHIS